MTDPSNDEAMRQAFADFMISGAGNSGSKKKKSTRGTSPSIPAERATTVSPAPNVASSEQLLFKKLERKYWNIYGAFQGTLQRDWLEVDDNLNDVVGSIANLRNRISAESRYLEKNQRQQVTQTWTNCGYRSTSAKLTSEDVHMALSHDLLQHEKMMGGVRMLLSSLAQAQETLGRRLEEIMMHAMEMTECSQCMDSVDRSRSSLNALLSRADTAQEIYSCLATELYRKQRLAQSVLETLQDDLLVADDEGSVERQLDGSNRQSIHVAERCMREWPRGSKYSCIHNKLLDSALATSETIDKSSVT